MFEKVKVLQLYLSFEQKCFTPNNPANTIYQNKKHIEQNLRHPESFDALNIIFDC